MDNVSSDLVQEINEFIDAGSVWSTRASYRVSNLDDIKQEFEKRFGKGKSKIDMGELLHVCAGFFDENKDAQCVVNIYSRNYELEPSHALQVCRFKNRLLICFRIGWQIVSPVWIKKSTRVCSWSIFQLDASPASIGILLTPSTRIDFFLQIQGIQVDRPFIICNHISAPLLLNRTSEPWHVFLSCWVALPRFLSEYILWSVKSHSYPGSSWTFKRTRLLSEPLSIPRLLSEPLSVPRLRRTVRIKWRLTEKNKRRMEFRWINDSLSTKTKCIARQIMETRIFFLMASSLNRCVVWSHKQFVLLDSTNCQLWKILTAWDLPTTCIQSKTQVSQFILAAIPGLDGRQLFRALHCFVQGLSRPRTLYSGLYHFPKQHATENVCSCSPSFRAKQCDGEGDFPTTFKIC